MPADEPDLESFRSRVERQLSGRVQWLYVDVPRWAEKRLHLKGGERVTVTIEVG